MTTSTRPIPTIAVVNEQHLSITELVETWCYQLIEALQFDYDSQYPNNDNYHFSLTTGRKYHKIIEKNGGVHCFVNKKTGEVYKPAGYNKPAKHVRYDMRIINERNVMLSKADWAGGYLYLRG